MRHATVLRSDHIGCLGCGEAIFKLVIVSRCRKTMCKSQTFFFGGWLALTRFLLLMTSVLREIGRGLPCNLRNKPQALQSTEPCSSRRHSGVVEV